MNRGLYSTISVAALTLALLALLAGCGTAPVAEGQVGAASDPRPNQASGLDRDLLGQVDAALAAKKAAGADVAAQALRDLAVDLDRQGHFEEANGNLKTAAQLLSVLRGPSNPSANGSKLPAIPAVPAAQPASAAETQGATVLNTTFESSELIKNWEQVGPAILIGKPV